MKQKTCKVCKIKFIPTQFAQVACNYKCAIIHAKDLKKEKSVSAWKKEKSALKESLLTKKDYLNILQKVFNTYIRQRDKGRPCISCGTLTGQMHAGHYRSVGSAPHLRFNENNVHVQCATCNNFLHGNLINYRRNLVQKIGIGKTEYIENYNETVKYSIDEVKDLIKLYKQKIKDV